MSLLDEARNARIVAPDERSCTKFEPFVQISPATRDALVELADAAKAFVATTSYYRQRKESRPEFEEFALALGRLQR